MKYVFLLILSASVIVIARIIILKYKSRVKTGEQFLDFLSFAYSEISYSSMTVNEIVGKFISLSGDAPDFLKESAEPIYKSVEDKLNINSDLTVKQKELIISFFASFGTSGEAEQLKHIKNYKSLFCAEQERLREECREKSKLITKLSVLLAVAVFVILV